MPRKKAEPKEISFASVERGLITACLLGEPPSGTPFICNRMAEKARRELLFPSGRKSAADKKSMLKHNPLEEYRASPYRDKSGSGPTALQMVACSVKKAMASLALDLPDTGTNKTQLERLLQAPAERAPLYGIPMMKMDVVRQAGMDRTPDIRTRAILPRWACKVDITFVKPVLRHDMVIKLLSDAGFIRGIGDWRPERGSGGYGLWEVVEPDDPRFLAILEQGGREAQLAALETPEFYDDETAELYSWFCTERDRRGFSQDGAGNGKGAKPLPLDDEEQDDEESTEAST